MKIYHNNSCTKSRGCYSLLQEKGIEFETIEYLKTPLSKNELVDLLTKLNISAKELVRKNEVEYKQNFEGNELNESQWIEAMVQYPNLIERPIIVKGDIAVIGRPIEKVIQLLDN